MPGANADAINRFGGMYGRALRGGYLLAEVSDVSAMIDVNRIEVPLVGQTKMGYKPGREVRDGTITIQKIDTRWELELKQFLTDRQRYLEGIEGAVAPKLRQFDLKLEYADPGALGRESWQLHGCQVWQLPLGFSITDDFVTRSLPFSWESEEVVSAFYVDKTNATVAYDKSKDYKFPLGNEG